VKAFLKLVITRIGRIVTELLSVKTVIAVVVTYVYLSNNDKLGTVGFLAVTFLWCLVIGFRYAMGVKKLIEPTVTSSTEIKG
jgi:hypothetical protein